MLETTESVSQKYLINQSANAECCCSPFVQFSMLRLISRTNSISTA